MATDSGDDCVQLEAFVGDSDDHILIGALTARACSQRLANG